MRFYFMLSFLLLGSFFNCPPIYAQTNNLNKDFVAAVAEFNTTSKNYDYVNLLARFQQIEKSSNNKDWIPAYYISLLYTRLSFNSKKTADTYANEAIEWAKKSILIQANDENYCALSMAQTAKMSVSPYLRWLKYEKSIYEPLQKAKKTNPNNPRVYILEASLKMNIPVLFGGGCDNSKPILIKAKQLIDKLVPDSILPSWGRQSLMELKEGCPF
jgi:hypothetical protein